MNNDAIDLQDALRRVQDDRELLLELFEIFSDDCSGKIILLKEAINKKDFVAIRDVAHSMRGASGNISAKKLYATFLQLEQLGKDSRLDGIDGLMEDLKRQWADFKVSMEHIKNDFQKNP